MTDPATARMEADRLLADRRSSARARTYAWHALGIVARDAGDIAKAVHLFRWGLSLTRREELRDRRRDLYASLGTALALIGRRQAADDAFNAALGGARGGERARILVRRGAARANAGRPEEAWTDLRQAAATLCRSHDDVWEARARTGAA